MGNFFEKNGSLVPDSLSASDLFWWHVETPKNLMEIAILFKSEDEITPAELRDTIEGPVQNNIRLRAIPTPHPIGRLRPFLVGSLLFCLVISLLLATRAPLLMGLILGLLLEGYLGTPWYWYPVQGFRLEDHIKLHVLHSPTAEALQAFIDESISVPLPKDKALWQVHVIHGPPGGGTHLLFRLHHVIGDGPGLRAWFDTIGLPPEHRTPCPTAPARPLGPALLLEAVTAWPIACALVLHTLWKLACLPRESNSPLKGPLCGRKRTAPLCRTLRVPLDEAKAVGKRLGPAVTLNDTVLAWLAGGLRRHFAACRLHPDAMAVRVTMPVNLRRPNRPVTLENRFALVFKSLPVHLPTPEGRLASVHARMTLLKHGGEARAGWLLMTVLPWLPRAVLRGVVGHFTRRASAVLTNVVGPAVPYRLHGHVLHSFEFWAPSAGYLGVGISVLTYCDEVVLGLNADEALVADWSPVVDALEQEWRALLAMPPAPESHAPRRLHWAQLFDPAVTSGLPTVSY